MHHSRRWAGAAEALAAYLGEGLMRAYEVQKRPHIAETMAQYLGHLRASQRDSGPPGKPQEEPAFATPEELCERCERETMLEVGWPPSSFPMRNHLEYFSALLSHGGPAYWGLPSFTQEQQYACE